MIDFSSGSMPDTSCLFSERNTPALMWTTACGLVLIYWIFFRCSEPDTEPLDPASRMARTADGRADKAAWRWRRQLSPEKYELLREGKTDEPNLMLAQNGIMVRAHSARTRRAPSDAHLSRPASQDQRDDGIYHCLGCGAALYDADAKYDAGCGWPCFYTCIDRAIRTRADADGVRTEAVCNACNCSIGHVFVGEKFGNPPPDERHCVNGTALVFRPAGECAGTQEPRE